jgi:hypothetical protein
MSNEQDLRQIELTIEQCKRPIESMEAFLRLKDNKDFKKVVEHDYFLHNASRLVLLRGDNDLPDEQRAAILREIDGIGIFKQYLSDVLWAGNKAIELMGTSESTRESILEEGI